MVRVRKQVWVSNDFGLWLDDVKKKTNGELNHTAITRILAENLRSSKTEFVIGPLKANNANKKRVIIKKRRRRNDVEFLF